MGEKTVCQSGVSFDAISQALSTVEGCLPKWERSGCVCRAEYQTSECSKGHLQDLEGIKEKIVSVSFC